MAAADVQKQPVSIVYILVLIRIIEERVSTLFHLSDILIFIGFFVQSARNRMGGASYS